MKQPTREEVLFTINKLIDEEIGIPITEDNLLIDCQIDSFGYAMLWLGLNENLSKYFYKPVFTNHVVDKFDYETLSVKYILDKVEEEFSSGENVKKEAVEL